MKQFKRYAIYFSISAVLLAAEFIGVSIIKADKSNDVVVIADSKQPGYEKQPGYAKVEASPAKMWSDLMNSNGKFLVYLGFVLALFPAIVGIVFDGQNGKPASWALWGSAVLSLFILMISYAAKSGSSSYEKRMCLDQYEQAKGNLDSLFPAVDNAAFLKDCK